jgi:heat shock protein HslJ
MVPPERGAEQAPTTAGCQSLSMRFSLIALAALGCTLLTGLATAPGAQAQNRPDPRYPGQDGAAVPQPRQDKQFPLGATWTAVSINGRPLSGERPSLVVDDQLRAKGFGGCNTYSATAYPLREQGFAVGPVAVTRKACEQGVMAQERGYLTALRGARKWDVVEGRLVVTGVAGEIRFERAL